MNFFLAILIARVPHTSCLAFATRFAYEAGNEVFGVLFDKLGLPRLVRLINDFRLWYWAEELSRSVERITGRLEIRSCILEECRKHTVN